MKVYPIFHSGFFVELEKHYLLFDYYKGQIPLLDSEKPLYVFVSHNHYDHYNPQIESVTQYYKNRKFIVNGVHDSKYIYANANEEILVDDVKITTFESTDEGVAFLVETEEKTIYHAGDLHLWYWDDDTEEERQNMYNRYMAEMKKLEGRNIDAAFVVLDSRQSDDYAMFGLSIFNNLTNTKAIFPMHYSHDENLMEKRITAMLLIQGGTNTMNFKMVHENYNVSDLEKSLKFYEEALGLHESRRIENENFTIVYVKNESSTFELELTWLKDHPQKYDLGECEFHLAFVTDDYEAAHKKHEEMGCICFENKEMGIYFIADPDGYWLEIVPEKK